MEEIWIVSYIGLDSIYFDSRVKIEGIYDNEDEARVHWVDTMFKKDGAFLDHWIQVKDGGWICLSEE